jgi:hypothetical protein
LCPCWEFCHKSPVVANVTLSSYLPSRVQRTTASAGSRSRAEGVKRGELRWRGGLRRWHWQQGASNQQRRAGPNTWTTVCLRATAGVFPGDLRSSFCDVCSVVPRSALMPYTTVQVSLGSCKTRAWQLEGCRSPGSAVCGHRCTGPGYILVRRISTSPSGCRVRSSNVFWQCIPGCGICLGPAVFRGASTSDRVSQSVLYTTRNHHYWLARRAQDLH